MRTKSILIVTLEHDAHSRSVAWALRRAGSGVMVWDWTRHPVDSSCSISLTTEGKRADRRSIGGTNCPEILDAIWVRRNGSPQASSSTHPSDREFIRMESIAHLRGMLTSLESSRWVNHPTNAIAAENKVRQLRAARTHGFQIPNTLVTNDPSALRQFYLENQDDIVHKTFHPMMWIKPDGTECFVETTRVPREIIDNDDVVMACPGIYQNRVAKGHELRVTVIGHSVFGAMLMSQERKETTDWRIEELLGNVPLKKCKISAELRLKCLALCRSMGLHFATIDLIVGSDGAITFLDLNQAGNFLFCDRADPTIRLFEAFCSFLLHGRKERASDGWPSLQEFHNDPAAREGIDLSRIPRGPEYIGRE